MTGTPHEDPITLQSSSQGEYANAPGSSSPDTTSTPSNTIENHPSTSTDRQPITLQSSDALSEHDNIIPIRDGEYGYASELAVQNEEGDVASQGSNDLYDEEARREIEEWEAKRKEPIQIHLEALHQAYRNVDTEYTVFAFGGTIPPEEVDAGNLTLRVARWGSLDEVNTRFDGQMRKQGAATKNRKRTPSPSKEPMTEFGFPLIGEKVEELCGYASIAPFGKGNRSVVNLEYRKAMEITPDRYELKPDPILRNDDILEEIANTLHVPCKLRAERAKLNIYRKGGFFHAHCDTPRSPEHIGTIVVGLPGAYYGGDLMVDHGGPEVEFKWGTSYLDFRVKELGLVPSTELRWAFLYGDCRHEVWSVTQGTRLSVAYDVFTIPGTERESNGGTAQSEDIYQALQVALADHKDFAQNGCMLAFGLSHSYPQTTNAFWKGLEARLKGSDAVLLQAVQRSQLAYSFKAAFQLRQNSGGTDAEQFENAECGNLSDAVLHAVYRNGMDRYEVVLADKPDQVEGAVEQAFGDPYLFDTLDHKQEEMPQLVWVDYPVSYGFKNKYLYIGNGPCDPAEAYSGVVMLVHVPPASKR